MSKQTESGAKANNSNDVTSNNLIHKESVTDDNYRVSFVTKQHETYYGKRKQQITTLIIVNAIASIYQVTYCILKNYILSKHHFEIDIYLIYPKSNIAIALYLSYIFSFLLTIIVNYITFYWVIRNEFTEDKKILKKTSLSNDEIKKLSIDENHEINKFLHKSICD